MIKIAIIVSLFFWIVGIGISLRGLLSVLGVIPPHSEYPMGEVILGVFPMIPGFVAALVAVDEWKTNNKTKK